MEEEECRGIGREEREREREKAGDTQKVARLAVFPRYETFFTCRLTTYVHVPIDYVGKYLGTYTGGRCRQVVRCSLLQVH